MGDWPNVLDVSRSSRTVGITDDKVGTSTPHLLAIYLCSMSLLSTDYEMPIYLQLISHIMCALPTYQKQHELYRVISKICGKSNAQGLIS